MITRSITGLIYISLVMGGIFLGPIAFAGVFLLFAAAANWEFIQLSRYIKIYPEKITAFISGIVLYSTVTLYTLNIVDFYILLLNLFTLISVCIIELFRKQNNPVKILPIHFSA